MRAPRVEPEKQGLGNQRETRMVSSVEQTWAVRLGRASVEARGEEKR